MIMKKQILLLASIVFLSASSLQAQHRGGKAKHHHKSKFHNGVAQGHDFYRGQPKVMHHPPGHATYVRRDRGAYFYYRGVFYQSRGPGFVEVRPPIGFRVAILPPERTVIRIQHRRYFYFGGIFYQRLAVGGYVVVEAPVGAIVDRIPSCCEEMSMGRDMYYRMNNTYYRRIASRQYPNGFGFEVVAL